jgi:hypothetical protein
VIAEALRRRLAVEENDGVREELSGALASLPAAPGRWSYDRIAPAELAA